jgi:hypothetical protein
MPDRKPDFSERSYLRRMALSRWENEGGALCGEAADVPPLTDAELVQLHVRVIALENLLITLLTGASDGQLQLARDMAAYISPRPGFTAHPLTLHAAAEMISLLERAAHFKDAPPRRLV